MSVSRLVGHGALVLTLAHLGSAPLTAATITVASGGDLQLALLNANPGDVIELASGATFTGNFTLPQKGDRGTVITLRSVLGSGGQAIGRIDPSLASTFAKLRSPNGSPALQTAPGAHHWRVEFLEIVGSGNGDLVALGDGSSAQSSLATVPHDLVIDRCYIHGDSSLGVKRCLALNSASTVLSNSHLSDCKSVGQDAQSVAGWNGPGPFSIVNNYLEGAGENLLFGGADPAITGLVPADIMIHGNLIAKPQAWRAERWQVKNLLELKNARRVTIDGNILEYNWEGAQSGFAVLFTVRNQDGRCPWCQVEQVTFTNNALRHVAAGVEILGTDDAHPSRQTQGIVIRNNLLSDIDPKQWGGNGYAWFLIGAPRDITIDHNTIVQSNASGVIQVEGPPVLGFTFTNNLTESGAYGIIGSDHAPGNDTISAFFPAARFAGNVFAGADPSHYPPGNRFPTVTDFRRQFVAFDSGDYHLVPGSAWHAAATDGTDIGLAFTTFPHDPAGAPRRSGAPARN
jgi:hypothetical protein